MQTIDFFLGMRCNFCVSGHCVSVLSKTEALLCAKLLESCTPIVGYALPPLIPLEFLFQGVTTLPTSERESVRQHLCGKGPDPLRAQLRGSYPRDIYFSPQAILCHARI